MISPTIKLAVGASIISLLAGTGGGYYVGNLIGKASMSADIRTVESELDSCHLTAIETERQNIEALKLKQDQIDEANTKFAEDMNNAKAELDRLTADYRNDKLVLTSKVKACVQTSRTDDSGAVVTETRAELDSEVAANIIGVGGRCDKITLQLNGLIDAVTTNAR